MKIAFRFPPLQPTEFESSKSEYLSVSASLKEQVLAQFSRDQKVGHLITRIWLGSTDAGNLDCVVACQPDVSQEKICNVVRAQCSAEQSTTILARLSEQKQIRNAVYLHVTSMMWINAEVPGTIGVVHRRDSVDIVEECVVGD